MSAQSKKEMIEEMRRKKTETEEAYVELNRIKAELFSLNENVFHCRDICNNMVNEIRVKKEVLNNLRIQYESVYGVQVEVRKGPNFLKEMKHKLIKKEMEKLVEEKIPAKPS